MVFMGRSIGVPTKAGAINIKYYEDDGFKGKVRSIGNIEFTYYGNTYTNKADIVGKFESQTLEMIRLVVTELDCLV